MSDTPVPLAVTLSAPVHPGGIHQLHAGDRFGVSALSGLSTYEGQQQLVLDLGDGAPPCYWGVSPLPGYVQPGTYVLRAFDGYDPSNAVELPVQVDGPLAFAVSPARTVAAGTAYLALGGGTPDNQVGLVPDPSDPDGLLFFSSGAIGHEWAVQRTRGTWDDPLARGELHAAVIAGNPANGGLWAGPVVVVPRESKPPKLVMACLACQLHPSDPTAWYGSVHWSHSDDWGDTWTYGGPAWEHGVSYDAWAPEPARYGGYLNGGTGLIRSGSLSGDGDDVLLLPTSQVNGPLYGPGGAPENWCPFGWAKVPLGALADALDAGHDTRALTRKWHGGDWTALYNGPAQPVAPFGGAWANQIVWAPALNLYLCFAQPSTVIHGNTIWLSWSRDLFTWSDPQLVYEHRRGPNWFIACPTVVCVESTVAGRAFQVWFEEWNQDVPADQLEMNLLGFTIRFLGHEPPAGEAA